MGIQSLYILFGTVAILGGLSLIFVFVNWLYLRSLNNRITALDEEIEKKAKEIDALRKERAARSAQQEQSDTGYVQPQPVQAAVPENPEIQIVRNIHDSYENPDATHMEAQVVHMHGSHTAAKVPEGPPASMPLQSPADGYPIPPDNVPVSQPAMEPEQPLAPVSPAEEFQEAGSGIAAGESDIMEVVDGQQTPTLEPGDPIRIMVYSDQKKDADFEKVSATLRNELPRNQNPAIQLDFANVNFLYEKEIDYLQKVVQYSDSRNLAMSFINCEPELGTILQKYPLLSAHIQA